MKARNPTLVLFILDHGLISNPTFHLLDDDEIVDHILEKLVEWGDLNVIKDICLTDRGYRRSRFLEHAVKLERWYLVEWFLEIRENLHDRWCNDEEPSNEHQLLRNMCRSGNVALFRRLLDSGADGICESLLETAVSNNPEMVRIILSAYLKRYPEGRANYGSIAIRKAIMNKDESLTRLLLNFKVDVNGSCSGGCDCVLERAYKKHIGATPLGAAILSADRSSTNMTSILVEYGADMNNVIKEPDDTRMTALCAAIEVRNLSIVRFLVEHGSDVNQTATRGRTRTPLQTAAEVGDFEIVEQLLAYGAQVNDTPAREAGGTPLQLAAIKGFLGIAWVLLENQADVNATPSIIKGRTALEGAAEHGRIDMVQLLLNSGADIEGPRGLRNGRALQLAERNGHFTTLELLQLHLPPTSVPASGGMFSSDPVNDSNFSSEGAFAFGAQGVSSDLVFPTDQQAWNVGDTAML